jgi:hypothetical protein
VTGKVSRSGDGLEITWENGGKDRNLSLPGDLYGVDQLGGWGVVVEEEQKAGGRVSPPLGPQAAYAMSEQACAGAASAGSSGKEEKHESKVEEVPHPEEERALLHRVSDPRHHTCFYYIFVGSTHPFFSFVSVLQ